MCHGPPPDFGQLESVPDDGPTVAVSHQVIGLAAGFEFEQVGQQLLGCLDASPFTILARPMEYFALLGQARAVGKPPLQFVPGGAAALPPTIALIAGTARESTVYQNDQIIAGSG